MRNFSKKIELTANIAIIVIASLIGTVLIKEYFLSNSSNLQNSDNNRIKTGEKISLQVDWAKKERTLLLVLSTNCRFCSESGPFYKRLSEDLQNQKKVQIIAVLPQDDTESQRYLNKLGVSVSEIIQTPLSSIEVRGTPTIILLDNTGKVINSWIGKLPSVMEDQVLNQAKSL